MRKKSKRSKKTSNKDSATGYASPPMHTRWEKGKSGNPKGRPRGRKNRATIFLEILDRKIEVTERGKRRWITWLEASLTSLCASAVKGDKKAIEMILKLEPEMERQSPGKVLKGMTAEQAAAEWAKTLKSFP